MKARQSLFGSMLRADHHHTVRRAFEKAWVVVSEQVPDDPVVQGYARLRLAEALLSIEAPMLLDAESLHSQAIQRYRADRTAAAAKRLDSRARATAPE
jgi:hypothetical protein